MLSGQIIADPLCLEPPGQSGLRIALFSLAHSAHPTALAWVVSSVEVIDRLSFVPQTVHLGPPQASRLPHPSDGVQGGHSPAWVTRGRPVQHSAAISPTRFMTQGPQSGISTPDCALRIVRGAARRSSHARRPFWMEVGANTSSSRALKLARAPDPLPGRDPAHMDPTCRQYTSVPVSVALLSVSG